MKSHLFLLSTVFLGLLSCTDGKDQHITSMLPNVVILLADDLGYSDLSCYGGFAHTPHLDRLAKKGIRFTSFYAAAPNCSPSRAGLLTGRSPSKVGIYNYLSSKHPMHLRNEIVTLAELLKLKEYHTGHFGKWHLGCLPQDSVLNHPQPIDQGFDYSFGTDNNADPSHLNPTNFIRNGQPVGKLSGYSCDLVVEEASQWLHGIDHENKPFLAYLAFHEPHKKVSSPPDITKKYSRFADADAEYLANVENLDESIGRLVSILDNSGLLENTILIFASDNGSYRHGSNHPLLGGKSFVYEGGIRVPGVLHWPKQIPSGQVIDEPAGLIDIVPTILSILEVKHPDPTLLDGQNLLPLLTGQPFERKKPLAWFFYRTSPEMAMRIGKYSILGRDLDTTYHTHAMTEPDMEVIKNLSLDSFDIYDLDNDISQAHPIVSLSTVTAEHLQRQMQDRLEEIQRDGYYWQNLPPAEGVKKLKWEWRQLRPQGFNTQKMQ